MEEINNWRGMPDGEVFAILGVENTDNEEAPKADIEKIKRVVNLLKENHLKIAYGQNPDLPPDDNRIEIFVYMPYREMEERYGAKSGVYLANMEYEVYKKSWQSSKQIESILKEVCTFQNIEEIKEMIEKEIEEQRVDSVYKDATTMVPGAPNNVSGKQPEKNEQSDVMDADFVPRDEMSKDELFVEKVNNLLEKIKAEKDPVKIALYTARLKELSLRMEREINIHKQKAEVSKRRETIDTDMAKDLDEYYDQLEKSADLQQTYGKRMSKYNPEADDFIYEVKLRSFGNDVNKLFEWLERRRKDC